MSSYRYKYAGRCADRTKCRNPTDLRSENGEKRMKTLLKLAPDSFSDDAPVELAHQSVISM